MSLLRLRRPAPEPLPSLRRLQCSLRKVTELLARCVAGTAAPVAATGAWDATDWRIAPAVAAMHGIAPLLSRKSWQGSPPGWQRFLDEQQQHTGARHQRLVRLLTQIDHAARGLELGALALKGVALHDLGIYAPGMRPMADIDLLVRRSDLNQAHRLMAEIGYHVLCNTRREQIFAPAQTATFHAFGEHRDNPIKIELHTHIAERLPIREVDITGLLMPTAARPGVQTYDLLSALMSHLLLHAAGNLRFHALRCLHLHDLASLAPRLQQADWRRVLQDGERLAWWIYPPLALVERYYPLAIPRWLLDQAARSCPRVLRRMGNGCALADVSLSRLRMTFFAGAAWCRSPQDLLQFVSARVWPSPQARSEIAAQAASNAWASGSGWYGMSFPRRALRWIVVRPGRIATLHSIRAAYRTPEPGRGEIGLN